MSFSVGRTINPVLGSTILSRQGQRANAWHNGIDLRGDVGTPVYAAAPGVIERATTDCLSDAQVRALSARERRQRTGGPCGCSSTYGNNVVIKHGEGFYTVYAHLDSVLVTVGQFVTTSTQIGTIGATTALPNDRCLSMAPHLHFEVVKAWPLSSSDTASRYDVLQQLAQGGVNLSGEALVVTGVAAVYTEPRLSQTKAFRKTGASFDPTAGAPTKPPTYTRPKWPLYVGFGSLILVSFLVAWGGSRRRRLDGLGAGGWGQSPQPRYFRRGQRVKTPLGYGMVNYQRMRPPEYSEAEAVSVILDAKQNRPGYSGTIFSVKDVVEE